MITVFADKEDNLNEFHGESDLNVTSYVEVHIRLFRSLFVLFYICFSSRTRLERSSCTENLSVK